MENTKKQGFCIGAIFPALYAVLYFVSSLPEFSFIVLLQGILLMAICILLFMKKQNRGLIVLVCIYALLILITLDTPYSLGGNISSLFKSVAWILIAFGIVGTHGIDEAFADKLRVFYIMFFVFSIVTAVLDVVFWSTPVMLLYGIGLILVGAWIFPPFKEMPIPTRNKYYSPHESYVVYESSYDYFVSMGKHICLLFFTAGIWFMIWIYKATKFGNFAKGEEEKNPTASLLLFLFVPFYSIYWTYKTAQRIDAIAQEKGLQSDLGTICLILSIFVPIVPPILMQEKINSAVTAHKAPAKAEDSGIDNLEKYKDLLDKGVITQEEFDAKKKQILGL